MWLAGVGVRVWAAPVVTVWLVLSLHLFLSGEGLGLGLGFVLEWGSVWFGSRIGCGLGFWLVQR